MKHVIVALGMAAAFGTFIDTSSAGAQSAPIQIDVTENVGVRSPLNNQQAQRMQAVEPLSVLQASTITPALAVTIGESVGVASAATTQASLQLDLQEIVGVASIGSSRPSLSLQVNESIQTGGSTLANGGGTPPAAHEESYWVFADTALTVLAPGILSNDNGQNLQASLVTSTAHGTLNLAHDGSFTYTPDADFTGTDSFTYKAMSGFVQSNLATVKITVQPLPSGSIGGGTGGPPPGATPELDSLALFASGLAGFALYLRPRPSRKHEDHPDHDGSPNADGQAEQT